MPGFTKLVPEIIQSSIWNEPSDTRIVWITMLAVKDENGYVRGDSRTIARMANVSLEAAETALTAFQKPDPSSHTPANEGRRIEAAPGGYVVLNHELYRTGDRTQYMRDYMREYREKAVSVNSVKDVSVNVSSQSVSVSASEYVSEEEKNKKQHTYADPIILRFNALYRRRISTPWTKKETKTLAILVKRAEFEDELKRIEDFFAAMRKDGRAQFLRHDLQTLLNNWTGELDKAANFTPSTEHNQPKLHSRLT